MAIFLLFSPGSIHKDLTFKEESREPTRTLCGAELMRVLASLSVSDAFRGG